MLSATIGTVRDGWDLAPVGLTIPVRIADDAAKARRQLMFLLRRLSLGGGGRLSP